LLKSIGGLGGYIIMGRLVDGSSLRRDNVAVLAEKTEIRISTIGQAPPAYTDENWDILAEVTRTTTSLKTLSFGKDAVIALQNRYVVEALTKNRTIKTLNLRATFDGDEGAKAVAAILKENSTIEVVDLEDNKITGEGARSIAGALKKNTSILRINLSSNNIGDKGAEAVADALKKNKSLRFINLGSNKIGAEGAKAIGGALKENKALRCIYLHENQIGDEGAKAIADALKENTSLRELSIGGNKIGEEGGKQILNALQQIERSVIKDIYLWGNQISEETETKIKQEIIRIKKRFKSVGSNVGQVAAVETIAGGSQGVQNKRSSNGNKEMPTTQTTNASQGSAENSQETNETGRITTAMEAEAEHLKSTITQLQSKIAEQDKELASTKDLLKTIGNLATGKDGDATSNSESSISDRETELQSENERYREEIDSLKKQLKNSRPIETVDLTNEIDPGSSSGGEDSNEEEPPSKRRRMKSNLAVALEQTQQLVQVKEEAKERAAVAEANVALARREKDAVEASLRDVQEDLEDSNELVTQQTLATNILQGRIDELCELARAAGVDGSLLSEIRYRSLSSGR
jgi:uncharacterized coiled-coil protein SlyX